MKIADVVETLIRNREDILFVDMWREKRGKLNVEAAHFCYSGIHNEKLLHKAITIEVRTGKVTGTSMSMMFEALSSDAHHFLKYEYSVKEASKISPTEFLAQFQEAEDIFNILLASLKKKAILEVKA